MSNQHSIQKVPLGQKIAFGLGMLANQMFPAALGIFMVVLVENLGMPSWMWGVLFFVPRIVDAFFDPIMGFISDNTKVKNFCGWEPTTFLIIQNQFGEDEDNMFLLVPS